MTKKTYQVHFQQVNELWIEVETSTPKSAIRKAIKEYKTYEPYPDTIEYPSGVERNLEVGEL